MKIPCLAALLNLVSFGTCGYVYVSWPDDPELLVPTLGRAVVWQMGAAIAFGVGVVLPVDGIPLLFGALAAFPIIWLWTAHDVWRLANAQGDAFGENRPQQ